MNADEIVRGLRTMATYDCGHEEESDAAMAAIDLIESLQAQLSASQRRADAAVEDIYKMVDGGECDICKHYNPDDNTCAKPLVHYDECFEWRGPQEAEKGENNA